MNADDRVFKKGNKIVLELEKNTPNFILGPNGSGKTTLMHYIRATRHSLKDINKKAFDGMTNNEDRLYANSKLFSIKGLQRYDDIFVLDSIDDDPLSFTNCASASGLIMGGGWTAQRISKGQKAVFLMSNFLKKVIDVTEMSAEDYIAGKKSKKHCLIIVDEVDEGMDMENQIKFPRMLENLCAVFNATVICICHNAMSMITNKGMDTRVYDMSASSYTTLKEYIKKHAKLDMDIKKI